MCNPGISPAKTDELLASELRRHLEAITACKAELNKRGYSVTTRAYSGYVTPLPVECEITKEVRL